MVKEFEFINFFRAIAAFWVLAAHCMIWGDWYGIPLPPPKMAVDLFMIISGYLMAANAFARNSFEPLSSIRNWFRFWLRRFFRLAPAYYLSLAIAIVTSSYFLGGYQELQKLNPVKWPSGGIYDPANIEYSLKNVMLHPSFLFGLLPSFSFSTFLPDWSLSLEMQFYFVFPALWLLMNKFGFVRAALYIGLPTIIVGFGVSKLVHYSEPSFILLKLQYFIAGILIFNTLSHVCNGRVRLAFGACAVFLVSLDYRYGSQLVVLPLLALSMIIVGWCEAENRMPPWIRHLLNSRLTRFASDTSYGVYLFHGFFISASGLIISSQPELLALPAYLRVVLMFLFVSTCAYMTAYAVFRCVELPGISFGKAVIQRTLPTKTKQASSALAVPEGT